MSETGRLIWAEMKKGGLLDLDTLKNISSSDNFPTDMNTLVRLSLCAFLLLFTFSCSDSGAGDKKDSKHSSTASKSASSSSGAVFSSVSMKRSNIDFVNEFEENEKQNYYVYEYLYNGGGVAVGDINNDGLPDIYFTGNLVDDKLYLNKGNMEFEDISDSAIKVGKKGWHSGVTMADVNDDGFVDIYVCRAGWYKDERSCANLLYINNGDMTFTESAREYGIAGKSRSTQGAFFDFDRDGDLDLYVVNSPLQGDEQKNNLEVLELIRQHKSPSDRLYRNDGGKFKDVTAEKGIWNMGYGLGLAVSDLDDNGFQDMYVANDYIERDQHYSNTGGEFEEIALESMRHISNFGMGCDAADINNDGLVDLLSVDMVSEDHIRSKKNMSGMSRKKFWKATNAGYHYQFMFNSMQINNGNGTFSEIANMAGISKTDWSWAPLFADFDNDGDKDLMVTNGFKRDMRDNDYMRRADELKKKNNGKVQFNEVLSLIPVNQVKNYLYQNNGDLTFSNVTDNWGFNKPVNSNGAAYADLDQDGDLDLVINNMDVPSEIFENNTAKKSDNHYIQIALSKPYTAISQGAKVTIKTADGIQFQELISTRGYQSSVEPILHFGLGDQTVIDELTVDWPDGRRTTHKGLAVDQRHALDQTGAVAFNRIAAANKALFSASKQSAPFTHKENVYDDFKYEVLLPHQLSNLGPHLSKGDANGDGLEDVFVGGAHKQAGMLLLGSRNGLKKSATSPWTAHAVSEDLGSVFFDADGDGDQDLYVVSGSNEVTLPFEAYNDRLYLNDGKGNYSFSANGLPAMQTSAERVTASDVDGDGDLDLFVGGRGVPGQYPKAPRSYLLENDGTGTFSDMTEVFAQGLIGPGLVTDAVFTDSDGDGDQDLMVIGEWMAPTLFENTGDGLVKKEVPALENAQGWWYSVSAGDIDKDGDEDLIVGNIGLNNKFHPTEKKPLHVYWNDFDGNGKFDIVLAKGKEGNLLPVRGRECSSEQCPVILDKFPSYEAFATASLEQIYGEDKMQSGLQLSAKDFHSYLLINDGKGNYTKSALPSAAQTAPIMGSVFTDVNNDGNMDVIIAGKKTIVVANNNGPLQEFNQKNSTLVGQVAR